MPQKTIATNNFSSALLFQGESFSLFRFPVNGSKMTPTSAVSIFRQRAIKPPFLDVEGENLETTIFSNGKLMKF